MRADALLTVLEARGVRLSVRDGKLVCNAPRDVLTAELRGHIKRLKPDVMALLDSRLRAPSTPLLSPVQRRVRDLAHLLPAASPAGNIPFGFEIRGPLDPDRLRRALTAVVEAHPVFRTVCAGDEAERLASAPVPLDEIDLRGAENPRARVDAEVARRVAAPFDLTRAPVLRASLFRLDASTRVLLVVTHVFAFDGRSTPLFTTALSAALSGAPTSSPAVYADLAGDMRQHRFDRPAQRAFWVEALDGIDLTCPLTDAPAGPAAPSGHLPVTLSAATSRAVAGLARACRSTVFHTVLAAFQTALHRHAGQASLAVGTIVSHRRGIAAESTIGSFAHNVLFPARFEDGTTFRGLVEAQRTHARSMMRHLDLPLEDILGELAPAQRHRRPFETMCVLHHDAEMPTLAVPDLDVAPFPAPKALTAHALDLVLAEHDGVIEGELGYDTARIERADAEAVVKRLIAVLETASSDPDMRVGDPAPPRPVAERSAWSGGAPETPSERMLAASWSTLFDRPGVPRDASFFDLGGHSLLALAMLAEVESRHGALPPGWRTRFAETPTVSTLASLIDRAR